MIKYKGYELEQAYNYHVSVFRNGKKVFHIQCKRKFTDDELKDIVDKLVLKSIKTI